jgi:hypothetical protein
VYQSGYCGLFPEVFVITGGGPLLGELALAFNFDLEKKFGHFSLV